MAATRPRALALYRRILQTARAWENPVEQNYIRAEARQLFRRNARVRDAAEVHKMIFEGESRLEIGVHYKIPYPRPVNVVPGATGKSREALRPAYMHSYKSVGVDSSAPDSATLPRRPVTMFELDEEDDGDNDHDGGRKAPLAYTGHSYPL